MNPKANLKVMKGHDQKINVTIHSGSELHKISTSNQLRSLPQNKFILFKVSCT